jgi:hypothetical protein
MKYTVVKRIHFSHANDYVTVIKEAETFEDAMKFKVAAEMLETLLLTLLGKTQT